MTRASSSRRRDSSTTPGSSALTIPASSPPSSSSRLNAAVGAGSTPPPDTATLRSSSRASIYSLSPSSRRHLTPLTNPAPSTSTTSLSPSHARSTGQSNSTATSRLRKVASNASIQLGLPPRLASEASASSSTSPPKAIGLSPPRASGSGSSAPISASSSSGGPKRADSGSSPSKVPAPPSPKTQPETEAAQKDADTEPATAMKRKSPPLAAPAAAEAGNSRRRTWFGFGSPVPTEPVDPTMGTPSTPPPMDADEAAFRLALAAGPPKQLEDTAVAEEAAAQPAEVSAATLTQDKVSALAKAQADQTGDGQSTAASSSSDQPLTNPRTTNSRGWFTWRAQVQAPAPPSPPPPPAEPAQADGKASEQGPSTPTQAPQPSTTTIPSPSRSSQPAYASPLRRMWNRSEQAPDAAPTETGLTASPVESTSEQQNESVSATTTTLARVPTGEQSREGYSAGASTWRFSLWPGRAPMETDQNQGAPTEEPKPNAVPSAGTSDIPSIILNKEVPNRGELESQGGVSDPSTIGQASYASYIANWIPGWSSGLAQGSSSSSTLPTDATDAGQGTDFVPRTPAEQVKADALARPERSAVLDTVSGSLQKLASPTEAILNSQTRKTWISYFSSRNAQPIRRITGASDNGPEVMDLDEDEAGQGSASPSVAESAPAVLRGSVDQLSNKGTAAAKAIVQKASAVTSAASSVVLKSGSKSAGASAPTSPVIGPVTKGGSPTRDGSSSAIAAGRRASADPKGKGATLKPEASNASLSSKTDSPTAQEISVPPNNGKASGDSKSAANSKLSKKGSVVALKAPNLVLPSFEDTFATPPRVWPPKVGMLERTIQAFNTYLFSKPPDFQRLAASTATSTPPASQATGKARRRSSTLFTEETSQRLPRSWEVMGDKTRASQRGVGSVRKVVVMGIRGWFAQFAILKNVMGEPTGTSFKFATMMTEAVRKHFKEAGWELNPEAITVIALEGDGRVADRVHDLSVNLLSNPAWVKDLHEADAIFFSAHSQGSIVGTEVLARLIEQKHIQPERTRVCLLAMAGIHEGPFPHLQSAIMSAYFTYFETAAAKELFEFMASTAHVSESYAAALRICLAAGVKAVYVASVDDQVVPLHGALHSAVSHPSILRALYIDGTAFPRADFLTNLLVLCTQVRNAGLNDHDVLSLLSTTVAGSLYGGVGHSNVYEEPQVYDLAVRYLFETTHPCSEPTCAGDHRVSMPVVNRNAFQVQAHNPYSLPWAIRGLLEDPDVRELFSEHMADLLEQFAQWRPTTKSQKDVQFRLSPLKGIQIPGVRQRTASTASSSKPTSPQIPSNSKL
ncbi:hypothetical protein CF319_g3011 [Tilletia indica]|nr:hypothetical protein CF319_g3011 [Tilletia indica]